MGPPLAKMSPRSHRDNKRRSVDRDTAQWEQRCLLGKLNSDEEPLSPEDIAAIKGTGSLYEDTGSLPTLYSERCRCPSPVSSSCLSGMKIVERQEAATEAKWDPADLKDKASYRIPSKERPQAQNDMIDKLNGNREDRFGGEDDYLDNFEFFRQAYRQWRIEGKIQK